MKGTDIPYNDGQHILYMNAAVDDGSEIAKLMNYIKTADPDDRSQGELSKRVHFLKCEEGGYEIMCEISEKIYAEGREEGELNAKKAMACNMHKQASMFMGINDDGLGLSVTITWPNGYNNSIVWELNTISGEDCLTYTGIKKIVYYKEDGKIDYEEIVSTDESGTFRQEIADNGYHVYWTEYKDNYNFNCDFLMVG